MTTAQATRLLRLGPAVLQSLRRSLENLLGEQAAQPLQEAGFASGDEFYDEFSSWLEARTELRNPQDLDASLLGDVLSDFFAELGWGTLVVDRIGPAALAVASEDWAEASGTPESEVPACNVTTGLLAAFLGRLAGDVVAVMEVECRTRGDKSCRFLIGSPETLQTVFDGMSRGVDYERVLTSNGPTS